jgi:hypothetical protein
MAADCWRRVAASRIMPEMDTTPRTHPFEFWWIFVGGLVGAGVGYLFPGVGIPIAAGLGFIVGLAVALLRKSREWTGKRTAKPHFHHRPKH